MFNSEALKEALESHNVTQMCPMVWGILGMYYWIDKASSEED